MSDSKNFDDSDDGLFEDVDLINNYEDSIDVAEANTKDKTLKLQQLISHFEYRLLGYMWLGSDEKYVFTGKPLIGDVSLQQIMLLLHPFSREIILISSKSDELWQKQLLRTRVDFASTVTNAFDIEAINMKNVWRSFTNLMFNIGDIILKDNSKNFMEKLFGIREYDDEFKDFLGKKRKSEDF